MKFVQLGIIPCPVLIPNTHGTFSIATSSNTFWFETKQSRIGINLFAKRLQLLFKITKVSLNKSSYYISIRSLLCFTAKMFLYRVEKFDRTVLSYPSISCISICCILLSTLELDMVEARLIWIPRSTEMRDRSLQDHGSTSASNFYEVRTFITTTYCKESSNNFLILYTSRVNLCRLFFIG